MKIDLVCNNCGHILFQQNITPKEVIKAIDVPYRIKTPVCSVCSKIKKEWVKK
jgi:rubredoxin